ncbi:MAG: hypothetical protein KDD62_15220, partial [Bdellovibrionales bacterium]|nr:hypothetical protein [Bdellovibrionales bacterium]
NPFPDLRKSSLGFELPFWVVNSIQGTRQPLFVKLSGSKLTLFAGEELWLEVNRDQLEEALIQVSASSYLAPRAMVITILLRLFVGDFFVHGLGGAKYDACTDEFMKAFYSIDAPEFTTASANQYLLAGERREFLEAKTLYDQKREMYFHPRSFADAGLFSESQLAAIEQYSTQKLEWIEQLKEKKKRGESAAEITQEIKKLERDIGAIVDSSVEAVLGPKVHISAEAQLAILCREYPYFFFL